MRERNGQGEGQQKGRFPVLWSVLPLRGVRPLAELLRLEGSVHRSSEEGQGRGETLNTRTMPNKLLGRAPKAWIIFIPRTQDPQEMGPASGALKGAGITRSAGEEKNDDRLRRPPRSAIGGGRGELHPDPLS